MWIIAVHVESTFIHLHNLTHYINCSAAKLLQRATWICLTPVHVPTAFPAIIIMAENVPKWASSGMENEIFHEISVDEAFKGFEFLEVYGFRLYRLKAFLFLYIIVVATDKGTALFCLISLFVILDTGVWCSVRLEDCLFVSVPML